MFGKDLPRHPNGGKLQLFLGTEVGEQAALAHL